MRMKVSGLPNVELVGDISDFRESDGCLMMNIRLTTPVGWQASAALTHRELMTLVRLMLKPSNLIYLLFGFGKPRKPKDRLYRTR